MTKKRRSSGLTIMVITIGNAAKCGRSGYTDTVPDCDCWDNPEDREPPDPPFNEISGDDHLRHIMEEAKKLK